MGPFPLDQMLGTTGAYAIYLLIGVSFGAVLEMAGFANTNKLAAQFYFKDQTVLKVMFTGIVVAMVLIFLASGLELLDFSAIWVSPTYLWPGILGGLIMGFGFIIGGFCPGTSLVAVATLKVDGLFFTIGALTGIFLFGETVGLYESFWNSSYLGRFTVQEWLGLSTGAVVMLVVLMALFMFWGAEVLEEKFGGRSRSREPKVRFAGAAGLVLLALASMAIGQPTVMDKWQRIAAEKEPLLTGGKVQIHPGELASLIYNYQINLVMLDLRDESDYNLFHIEDVKPVDLMNVERMAFFLQEQPANTVTVLIDNNGIRSTEAWKALVAEQVQNVYILEGGINKWLNVFGHEGHQRCPTTVAPDSQELRHVFDSAIGSKHASAEPDWQHMKEKIQFTPKVKLEAKGKVKQGGCS